MDSTFDTNLVFISIWNIEGLCYIMILNSSRYLTGMKNNFSVQMMSFKEGGKVFKSTFKVVQSSDFNPSKKVRWVTKRVQ